MAQTKERVILVDCDMRKAIQHNIFGLDNQAGLANLIVGNADLESVIQDTGIPNLKLVSCGPTPPNPIELLKSQRMEEILSELRAACDVLLCDSPPILPVTDSLILASKLDGVLFVADLDHTPRDVIRQAQEQLSKLSVPLLGLICNKVGTAKYSPYYR
jgi:capsular exopolysaccharide synthesis family protein